jgi:hypothetical protein
MHALIFWINELEPPFVPIDSPVFHLLLTHGPHTGIPAA